MFNDFIRTLLMMPDQQAIPKAIQLVICDHCHHPYRYESNPRPIQGFLIPEQAKELLRRRRIMADVPPCPQCGRYPTYLLKSVREGQAAASGKLLGFLLVAMLFGWMLVLPQAIGRPALRTAQTLSVLPLVWLVISQAWINLRDPNRHPERQTRQALGQKCRAIPIDYAPPAEPAKEVPDEPAVSDHLDLLELPCSQCGLNLRDLPPEALCPQCGTARNAAVSRYSLRNASNTWRKRLSFGLRLTPLALFIPLIAGVIGLSQFSGNLQLQIAMHYLALLPTLVAGWLITSPDRAAPAERFFTLRKIARIAVVLGVLLASPDFFSAMFAEILTLHTTMLVRGLPRQTILICSIGSVTFITIMVHSSMFRLLAQIAARIPDAKLVKRARFLSIGAPLTYCFIMFAFVAPRVIPGLIPGSTGWWLRAGLIACQGLVVVFFLHIQLVVSLRRAIDPPSQASELPLLARR